MESNLTLEKLVTKRENSYFGIAAVIAGIVWLAVVLSIVGLIYLAFFALFLWIANGLFVARIRAESIECSETQFATLYNVFRDVCAKLQLKKVPRLFVLQADGALNAFATRHSGRDFVVVYSSMLEAYGVGSKEITFLLGHEVGHIERKHLLKTMFLLPARLVPLLGDAYRRAVEETCDRYGAFVCGDLNASAQAITILASGKDAKHLASPQVFAEQYLKERGFFISWHELTSSYPTLSQRVYSLLSLAREIYPQRASRNPFAYFCAFVFCRQGFIVLMILIWVATYKSKALPPETALHQQQPAHAESANQLFHRGQELITNQQPAQANSYPELISGDQVGNLKQAVDQRFLDIASGLNAKPIEGRRSAEAKAQRNVKDKPAVQATRRDLMDIERKINEMRR